MIWQTSDQKLAKEKTRQATKMSYVDAFTPQTAATYARRMVERETRGNGDQMNALERVGRKCGLTARSLRRLISGETKDPGISVFSRVRAAYLEYCARQIAELQHELEMEKERTADALDEDLLAQVQSLAEKVAKAKGRMK